ncbi:MAG: AgmX/PglI C-terminal domain-containing protein, partial [Polyangiales bacterium]
PATATPAPRETQAPAKVQVDLEANVANARVTFRRRVSAAPSTMQITPSDIVELVEVSAPGHKTLRYWLTFDRPTHLNAKLVKGSGLEEASEEATLIALGEVSAPASPAVAVAAAAAAPVVVAKVVPAPVPAPAVAPVKAPEPEKIAAPAMAKAVAKTVETPAPKIEKAPEPAKVAVAAPTEKTVAAPRKIGKGAAEETKIEATAAAMPEPTPAVEPAPVVEPVKTAEPAVVKPEPKVEPVAEPALAKPAIDKATLSSVVGQHRPEILKCLAEGKKKAPTMKGTVTLQLQVDAAGKVRAQVQSTLGSPLVAACVIKAANGWRFPSRSGGEMANIAYPFTIN